MRVQGLSYGVSLAHPGLSWQQREANERKRAKVAFQVAFDLYLEEWSSMPVMMRPAVANCTPERAYRDGFITGRQYDLITKGGAA